MSKFVQETANCCDLRWTDLDFIRDVILFLATQGWQKIIDEEDKWNNELADENDATAGSCESLQAINRLISRFQVPLEASGTLIPEEFREMLSYATQFISLSSTHYQRKLFHSPNASEWFITCSAYLNVTCFKW